MRDDSIKTARRVFEVLEMFFEMQRPLRLKEIVDRYDYPASSASVLLKSLVVLGYLNYDNNERTYFPTMRVARLGSWVHDSVLGDGNLKSLLEHLSEATLEIVTLGVHSDLFIQYVHVVQSNLKIRFRITPGSIYPITRSGMGWLFLSLRPDEIIDRFVRRANANEKDPKNRVALDDIMKNIAQIRKDGYVYTEGVTAPGGAMIAMELPERIFGRTLAVGVHGALHRIRDNKPAIIKEMRRRIRRLPSL